MNRVHDMRARQFREKIAREEEVTYQAMKLYEQFKEAGVQWAACVQAVKTDWIAPFQVKWGERLAAVKSS